jgi:hypothetical protein
MKKSKLLVKEVEVLCDVICKKVNEGRKKRLEELVGKDKEYKMLVKRCDELVKKVEVLRKEEEELVELNKKVNKKLMEGEGGVSFNRVLGWGYSNVDNRVGILNKYVDRSEVYNRLMVENMDGELKVGDMVDRLVEEFLGK